MDLNQTHTYSAVNSVTRHIILFAAQIGKHLQQQYADLPTDSSSQGRLSVALMAVARDAHCFF